MLKMPELTEMPELAKRVELAEWTELAELTEMSGAADNSMINEMIIISSKSHLTDCLFTDIYLIDTSLYILNNILI